MELTVTGTSNLVDAMYAKDYYNVNESTIGNYLVFPETGRRTDNNQIWGTYESYDNFTIQWYGTYYTFSCINGHGYFYSNGSTNRANWHGGLCDMNNGYRGHGWNSTNCRSCFKNVEGWH